MLRPNFLPGGPHADLDVKVNNDCAGLTGVSGAGTKGTPVELNFSRPSRIEFRLYPDSILCKPYSANSIDLEIAFLGQVMAVWMETRGVMTLHAGAVTIEGRTVGFMGNNGAGKSTLTSMLVAAGAPLVTDDVLAVVKCNGVYSAWPSYPSMRMWPKTAQMAGVDYDPLVRVYPSLEKRYVPVGPGRFGSFHDQPAPLKRIYVLGQRCNVSRARIEPMSVGEAIFELANHSFAGHKLHSLGVTAQRFHALTALGSSVSVKRMSVPEGLDNLGGVEESILSDLASDAGQ